MMGKLWAINSENEQSRNLPLCLRKPLRRLSLSLSSESCYRDEGAGDDFAVFNDINLVAQQPLELPRGFFDDGSQVVNVFIKVEGKIVAIVNRNCEVQCELKINPRTVWKPVDASERCEEPSWEDGLGTPYAARGLESQGMAIGVDKGVDMGICVPGNNGVNTVVAAWSTLPKLCLLGGTLVDPGFAQGRPSGIFQLWHIWLSDAAQAARGTGGVPFQTFSDTLS
ncbi:hypothetical protein C8J57DRAFT_1240042 [Mycena rebaudengoi]|nr:hypothetical protein C8J57DRAFT_1240042 [Mycena rebaudengoi]